MKIAYFGCDLFMGCLDVFQAQHHEVAAIFTTDNVQSNKNICDFAASRHIPCITDKPDQSHIQILEDKGVECFFSIEYQHLIPLPSPTVMTLNMHPTLLPEGRGATPLSHLILQYPEQAGVTFHKLSDSFDSGDIVFQSPVQLDANESLESLFVKLHYQIPVLLNKVLMDLPGLYQKAKLQTGGSEWPKITLQDRLLDWQDGLDKIDLMVRAFGRFGVVACIADEAWRVTHVDVHQMSHSAGPGQLLLHDQKVCVVAVSGGIVIIYKDSIVERRDI